MKFLKKIMCVLAVGVLACGSVSVHAADTKEALECEIAKARTRVQIAINNLGRGFDYNQQQQSDEYKEYLLAKVELDDLLYFKYLIQLDDISKNR